MHTHTRAFLCIIFFFTIGWNEGFSQGFFKKPFKEIAKGGKNFSRVIDKSIKDAKNTIGVAVHDIGKATGTAATAARKQIEKALWDASAAANKGVKDIAAETIRVGPNALDAGKALKSYLESSVQGSVDAIQDANNRIREGKLLDAMFHLALDPLTAQEEAAFIATQESGWLNTVAATAASAYGGPAGAAAYATWQTYKATGGNAELAIRAGLIVGMTSCAMTGIENMKGGTTDLILQKAILAGSVGGLAIAASGGGEDDIRDAFLMAGGMILIQDGYNEFTGHKLETKGATRDPYCTSPSDPSCATLKKAFTVDEYGDPSLNTKILDPKRAFVGIGADPANPLPAGASIPIASDQSTFMRTVAKIPGMNAMGLFHDKWVVSWKMSATINKTTIFPAILITYYGTQSPLLNTVTNTIVDGSKTPGSASSGKAKPVTGTPGITTSTSSQQGQQVTSGFTPTSVNPEVDSYFTPVTPTQIPYEFHSKNGNDYVVSAGKVFNKFGQLITDNAIIAESKLYGPQPPVTTSVATSSTPPGMFNFGQTVSTSQTSPIDIPCGYWGLDEEYTELPAVSMAMKYSTYKPWEKAPFETMFAVTHATAREKSIIYYRNVANGKMVRVYVIGKVSDEDISKGITVRLSQKALDGLGATGKFLWLEGEYEDISMHTRTIKRNDPGLMGRLIFNNLRDGQWRLRIFSNDNTLYTNNNYKNELKVNFQPGVYGFELANISPGQLYWVYNGTFQVK